MRAGEKSNTPEANARGYRDERKELGPDGAFIKRQTRRLLLTAFWSEMGGLR